MNNLQRPNFIHKKVLHIKNQHGFILVTEIEVLLKYTNKSISLTKGSSSGQC